jgi:hypothetical protein
MAKNPCGKMVDREHAYEVWQNDKPISVGGDIFGTGTWTWYILKKYQNEENESKNQYARWMCDVVTPICPDGEIGDVYVSDIKPFAKRIK